MNMICSDQDYQNVRNIVNDYLFMLDGTALPVDIGNNLLATIDKMMRVYRDDPKWLNLRDLVAKM